MNWRNLLLSLSAVVLSAGVATADTAKKSTKEESSFGALRSPGEAEARKLAEAWLKAAKADAASQAKVKKVWDGDGTKIGRAHV